MLADPDRSEISEHTGKLIVGVIALSLAGFTSFFSGDSINSISESYHMDGWARDIFVGLFAITAFLLAYNGKSRREMVLSKLAALAAIGVAMFPCKCEIYEEIIPKVHGISAAVMFIVLAFFCYTFYRRAKEKSYWQAQMRARIYAFCGISIASSILILAIDNLFGGFISSRIEQLTFLGESIGLAAFGIAWLTASRLSPFVTIKDEMPPSENQTEEATR